MLLYTKSASCAAYVCGRSAGLLLQFLAAVCSDYCCWSFGLSPIALKGYLLLGVKKYIQSTIHKCVVLHINTVYVDVSYTYKVRGECIFAYNWCVDVVRVARGCASLEGGVVAAKAKVITYIHIHSRVRTNGPPLTKHIHIYVWMQLQDNIHIFVCSRSMGLRLRTSSDCARRAEQMIDIQPERTCSRRGDWRV